MNGIHEPGTRTAYEIVVRGEFGELFTAAFADLTVECGNGRTVLTASVVDQAEFYGILDRLRDLRIDIIGLSEIEPTQPLAARLLGNPEDQGRN